MSMNIRFPNITAPNVTEQVNQIKNYLYQLVEQLNWALSVLESNPSAATDSGGQPAPSGITEESFNELKALLAQSGATLDSYYEKINNRLKDHYVSQEDFNAYKQESEETMDGKYVSQTSFDAYKQEVSQSFDDLDAYKQTVTQSFEGLDSKYTKSDMYNAYTQENNQKVEALQTKVAELQQRIDAMQQTGGE